MTAGSGTGCPIPAPWGLGESGANPYGPCWDRTSDLGIKSPLLYQLS